MRFPVRARIIDVVNYPDSAANQLAGALGFQLNTPLKSKPYVGKEGVADQVLVPFSPDERRRFDEAIHDLIKEGKLGPHTPEEVDARINSIESRNTKVRIILDDGTILWGYECWWEPITEEVKVEHE